MTDHHEMRIAAMQGGMELLDALDDEALERVIPVVEALHGLAQHLKDQGLPSAHTVGVLVGLAIEAGLRDRDGGEGRPWSLRCWATPG